MPSFEPKKLALLRIWQILKQYSDSSHPLTQETIAAHLSSYGIEIERKAIGRNLSLLQEAGIEIKTTRSGVYLSSREFEDSELRLLIDGILCSKYITPKYSADLISRLCGLSNVYFRARVKNVYSVDERNKTENPELFLNIDQIDSGVTEGKQLRYHYNKYAIDKKLHKTSTQIVSPYQLLLHKQHYYLMAYNEQWGHMCYHRLDKMTDVEILEIPARPIQSVPGYQSGIDYHALSTTMPYLFSDPPVHIEFISDGFNLDSILETFGKDVQVAELPEDRHKIRVSVTASPMAMEYWALQYLNSVEILEPKSLREQIREDLELGVEKYRK